MVFHEITPQAIAARRRHPARDRRATWSTPRRPAASSTGSTATRSARCCGRRCCRGCRPGGCSRWPPGSSSSASGPGWRSTPPSTGTSRRPSRRPSRKPGDPETFTATLVAVDDVRVATGRDFDPATGLAPATSCTWTRAAPAVWPPGWTGARSRSSGVEEKPYRRRPYPPFMTSTLQQEARPQVPLGLGHHDAHRAAAVRERLHHLYAYRLDEPVGDGAGRGSAAGPRAVRRRLRSGRAAACTSRKVKNAQEAHEAIRPAGDSFRTPGEVRNQLSSRRVPPVRADLAAHAGLADGRRGRHDGVGAHRPGVGRRRDGRVLDVSGRTITFPGFLRAYVEDATDEPATANGRQREAAAAARGPRRRSTRAASRRDGHSTSPPARYTEPSLVKALEELGVGRPSTYASILQTIQDRGYVWKKGAGARPVVDGVRGDRPARGALQPGWSTTASPRRSSRIWTTSPTASVRASSGCAGSTSARPTPTDAQRISAQGGLKALIADRLEQIDARGVNSIPIDGLGRRRAGRPLRAVPAAR